MLNFLVIAGPIVLALALLWAMTRNRQSRREAALTEAATKVVRDRQDADDKARASAPHPTH